MKRILTLLLTGLTGLSAQTITPSPAAATSEPVAQMTLPLERSSYFVGEKVLISAAADSGKDSVKVELIGPDQKPVTVYEGKPGTVVLDTGKLAPGDYTLDGKPFYLAPVLRPSVASLQEESVPSPFPNGVNEKNLAKVDPASIQAHQKTTTDKLHEIGLTASMGMMNPAQFRPNELDLLGRSGMLYFNNPETRPISFLPVKVDPAEREGMSQRMLLSAQASSRYPNFGGFTYGFDTTGFAVGGRKMLLTYWSWGNQADALRKYIDQQDDLMTGEFKKQTGLEWVSFPEYLKYTLALGRSDMAPVIDLPTVRWADELAKKMKPLSPADKADLEKRMDAWSAYLMGIYEKNYGIFSENLRSFDPTLKNTSSVQIDHSPTAQGQYFPSAYRPLDFRYQSTWNDQIDGPDYLYQWLFTGGLLNMDRPDDTRTWISGVIGPVHDRAAFPGKFTKMAAHNLANGVSGLGFALEGFSTPTGGMNHFGGWEGIKGKAGGNDITAGKNFLDRFAWLAVEGRGDYGVGVLFSKTQLGRQAITQGFGTPQFNTFITLARLGYTPVFLSEEEIAAKKFRGVKNIVVPGQVVELPTEVLAGLQAFAAQGGRVLTDKATTVDVAATGKIDLTMPLRLEPGKPHNYQAPGSSPVFLWADLWKKYAPAFEQALGGVGHAFLKPESGVESNVTLMQIKGGAEATYLVAINDSFVSSQADWKVVNEKLLPEAGAAGFLYDLTAEKARGPLAPVDCELANTTARVYALLPRELGSTDLSATQSVTTGGSLAVAVSFKDKAGSPLAAVLPFYLNVVQPDGQTFFAGYRGTDREGKFALTLDLPVNAPVGNWRVEVRSQLDGSLSSLPVTVAPGKAASLAVALTDPVLVREKAIIEKTLAKGQTVWLPLFGDQVTELAEVAKRLQAELKARGVTVEIKENPPVVEYLRAFELTPEQAAVNAQVDRGEALGLAKRTGLNGNDWFGTGKIVSTHSLIVLDVVEKSGNPVVQAVVNLLWPKVQDVAPAQAVVQGIAWAFGPQVNAVVIQAMDEAGLNAAVNRLAQLPEDFLTTSVRDTRTRLMQEFHLGGTPPSEVVKGLTANGLTVKSAPQPFQMTLGDAKPFAADQAPIVPPKPAPVIAVPGFAVPKDYTPMQLYNGEYRPAAMARAFSVDLRFSDAIDIEIEVAKAGKMEVAVDGIFRFSDGRPATQPVWEDYLLLWDQYLKGPRQPMSFAVWLDGKPIGKLEKSVTEEREVPLNISMASTGQKPRMARETVATSVEGSLSLPAGKHVLRLIPNQITDGQLKRVRLGISPEAADAIQAEAKVKADAEKKAAAEAKAAAAAELKKQQAEAAKKAKEAASAPN